MEAEAQTFFYTQHVARKSGSKSRTDRASQGRRSSACLFAVVLLYRIGIRRLRIIIGEKRDFVPIKSSEMLNSYLQSVNLLGHGEGQFFRVNPHARYYSGNACGLLLINRNDCENSFLKKNRVL